MSTEPTALTFAEAYEQLKQITERLNSEEVEADELVGLLRQGKGLEAALRTHLTEIEQEVTEIEQGQGIAAYSIVRGDDAAATAIPDQEPSDFVPSAASSSDDIPF